MFTGQIKVQLHRECDEQLAKVMNSKNSCNFAHFGRECDEQLAKVMNSKNSCNFAHFGENYMNWFNSFVAGTDVRKNTALVSVRFGAILQ